MSRVGAVLLAAGASRRLASPKQLLLEADGVPRVRRAADQLLEAGCSPVVVVTGAYADAVSAAVHGLPVTLVHNAAYADGMGTSIARGIRALQTAVATAPALDGGARADAEDDRIVAVLIAACDMPTADRAHHSKLLKTSRFGLIRVGSSYVSLNSSDTGGIMPGIPAIFPLADWAALHALSGDRGAKALLAESDTLSVPLFRGMFDLDTPDDVAAWRASPPPTFSPSSDFPMSIAQTAFADLDHEFANTRRMLERIPADHLDYTPHPKSWPLRKLAAHLTDFGGWGSYTIQHPVLDFATPQPPRPPMNSAEDFLKAFDEGVAGFKAAMPGTTDEQMMETWTMKNGDAVIMSMPKLAVLRGMVISHMIHHRAQLTLYYRMLDIPVPGLYGPSADEQ